MTAQTPAPTSGGEAGVGAGQPPMRDFNAIDRAILEVERLTFRTPAGKEAEIFDRLAMTPVTYYVRLNWILNQPEALAYDAQLVNRLINLRDRRRAVRTRGTVAAGVETRPDTRGTRPALLGGVVR
jgi:hypothetical protein